MKTRTALTVFVILVGILSNPAATGMCVGGVALPAAEQPATFEHYAVEDGLADDMVYQVSQSQQGFIWISSQGGLDPQNNIFKHYFPDPNNPNSLAQNDVRKILPAHNGNLWLATGNVLDLFDPNTKTFTHYQHDPANPNTPLNNNILSMAFDARGRLWLACYPDGASRFDPVTGNFTHFWPDANNPNSLIFGNVLFIGMASDQAIRFGTEAGMSRLDAKTEKFTSFTVEKNGLSNATVPDIFEDSARTLWVATDNDLNRYDSATDAFKAYYAKDGLSGNKVVSILEDSQGYLWVGTNGGLSRFDPRSETFRNYDVRDGLQGNLFAHYAKYKTVDGELFFGGTNGFNTFYPEKLRDNLNVPQVVLTDFRLLNQPVSVGVGSSLQKHINVAEKITLPYDYTPLPIKFAALNYRLPAKNQYAYKLEGFDAGWLYTDSANRQATYTNLDPGEYTFRVKTSNMDLVMPIKTGIEASLEIRQRPGQEDILIVAVSASVLEAEQEKSRLAGCNVFLLKPVDRQRLLEIFRGHLKLNWCYAAADDASETVLIPPPMEELARLRTLTRTRRVFEIREFARRLVDGEPRSLAFYEKILEPSSPFDLDAIERLIEQFMPKES